MYNPEQKQDFLSHYCNIKNGKTSMISRAEQALQRIGKYEQEWGCDLCEQTNRSELQKAFDDIRGESSSYSSGQISVLRSYCKWAHDTGIVSKVPVFMEIKKPSPSKMVSKTISSPLDLQIHLNNVFDPEAKENMHNVYRAFFWLAFIGFTESQAFNILSTEVDLKSKTIQHDDLILDIYPEGLEAIKNCAKLNAFYFDNPKYSESVKTQGRVAGDLLLRGLRKNPGKHLNSECSRLQTNALREGKITKQLNFKSVWRSGVFYNVFRQEQINQREPDFKGYALRLWLDNRANQSRGLETKFDPNNENHVRYVHVTERGLISDYKLWKQLYYNQTN